MRIQSNLPYELITHSSTAIKMTASYSIVDEVADY